jgi:hypothetical protein
LLEFFLEVAAIALAWYFYGWQLSIIVFLILWVCNVKVPTALRQAHVDKLGDEFMQAILKSLKTDTKVKP